MSSRAATMVTMIIIAALAIYGLAKLLVIPLIGPPGDWERAGIEIDALAAFAALITALWVAVQSRTLTQQVFADMAVRLHDEFFFKGRKKKIIRAIERGVLGLKPGKYLSEKLAPDNCERKKILWYEEEDLDDYLGVVELLHVLRERDVLDLNYIEELFGHYICSAWKDPVVQKYIAAVREAEGCQDYYKRFEKLAEELGCNDKGRKGF